MLGSDLLAISPVIAASRHTQQTGEVSHCNHQVTALLEISLRLVYVWYVRIGWWPKAQTTPSTSKEVHAGRERSELELLNPGSGSSVCEQTGFNLP